MDCVQMNLQTLGYFGSRHDDAGQSLAGFHCDLGVYLRNHSHARLSANLKD
jgi:hypothetical protein